MSPGGVLLMTAQVWVDYSCWWSTSACLIIFLQAVLFTYFPPTHLVSCVCQAGRREKTPGSFICRQQGYGKRRQDSKFLLSIFFSSPGSQTSHHLILPLGHGIALQPKHCLLFSCSVTDTTTDVDVALSFCTRYQYWALGQDFQRQLMIMSVLIW